LIAQYCAISGVVADADAALSVVISEAAGGAVIRRGLC
jgi:hypothetical protein